MLIVWRLINSSFSGWTTSQEMLDILPISTSTPIGARRVAQKIKVSINHGNGVPNMLLLESWRTNDLKK